MLVDWKPIFTMSCGCMQGTIFFLSGVFLVVIGWAIIGTILETYGFWLLFRGFFPTVLGFLRRLPMMGAFLDAPGIKSVSSTSPASALGPILASCMCIMVWQASEPS